MPCRPSPIFKALKVVSCVAPAVLALVGCAPKQGPAPQATVTEIEEIEMAPTPTPAPAASGEAARQAVDEEKAAADKAIDEAGKSIEPPPAAPPAQAAADAAVAPAAEPPMKEKPAATPEPPAVPSSPEPPAKPAEPAAAPAAPAAPAGAEKITLGDPSLTAGVPGEGPITLEQIEAWLADPRNHVTLEPVLPLGLSQAAGQITGLDANPLTRAKIELGRQLYFDTRLSADSTISCASCHDPAAGYTAHTATGVGIGGQKGGRNSPVSYNRILTGPQFWDGRVDSLEAQAVGPIQNPIEMGFTHEGVVKRLGEIPVYRRQFERIFGDLTIDRVGQAIAAFERVIVTGPSPYDFHEQLLPFAGMDEDDLADDEELAAKYAAARAAAEAHPLSEPARRGRDLFFGKANCSACHVGANLADEKYHNLGVGMAAAEPDLGRFTVSKDDRDRGAFKTPTIRNVALTAPYMHDGSQATLEEVVAWYDKGGHPNPHLSDKIKPLGLSEQERADLVEFMRACTGDLPPVATGRLPAAADL